MKIFFLSICTLCVFATCKKSDEVAYSRWYIGMDTFITNNVIVSHHKVDMIINEHNNAFFFTFPYSDIGDGDVFLLTAILQNSQTCTASFNIKDSMTYLPSPLSKTLITINKTSGKANWTMSPTWCVNYYNKNDSVLIGGEFSEP